MKNVINMQNDIKRVCGWS